MSGPMPRAVWQIVTLVGALVWLSTPISGQHGATNGEWRSYGGDAGGTKYSSLDQINKDNVKNLRIAWRWKSDNFGSAPNFNWEATPIMVGGVLYTTAGANRQVVAIDAATGETLWTYRPSGEGARGRAGGVASSGRGVEYWTNGKEARIFAVTRGYNLIGLDAKSGRPAQDFGEDGVVDLYRQFDQEIPEGTLIGTGSPPVVVGDVVVVGTPGADGVAGHLRGYDARTGRRKWIFHTIPRAGEFGTDTWENGSWAHTGRGGVWSLMTADAELGYVYVPLESPGNDYYGGHRGGANLFGHSLVCIDAKTGKRVWHFQTVHHGLWDYDLPAPPNLVDITVNGKRIKAVAQVTKQGFTFVLDRVTGQPVWPIEERPVPQSDVPGQRASLTQPFPTRPAPFDRQGMTADDLIDFTPALKAEAVKITSEYKIGPLYTPPIIQGANGLKGLIFLPGFVGGGNWTGAAFDPETGMLYVPSTTIQGIIFLKQDPKHPGVNFVGERPWGPEGPQGLPLVKPPWGRITAIDLNTGGHVWMMANADTPDYVKSHPALKGVPIPRTGTRDRSGLLVTKTLLFAGEGGGGASAPNQKTDGGRMLRAYDKRTGAIVWEFELPARQTGLPATYMVGGKQFIVVATGAPGHPAELVALALAD